MRFANWKSILHQEGIPPRYYEVNYPNHPATAENWDAIESFARRPNGNILMAGPCGNGKTMNAVAIVAVYTAYRGYGARYYNAETLYGAWRDQAKIGGQSDLANSLSETPLLVLDDLGQGEITDAFKRWVYSIVNKRWEWERPTVATTNLNVDEFRSIYGDAILSRLMDGQVWRFEGKDHRLRNRKQHGE